MDDGLRLFFLRHGRADRSEYRGDDDTQRPLTAEGRLRLARSAEMIGRLGAGIDVVITSPLARAAETADIVARRLGLGDAVVQDDALAPGFDVKRLASILARLSGDHRCLMLVGHEPDFSEVIGELTGGSTVVMKKGALARVDLAPARRPRGHLVWLLQPRVLVSGDERLQAAGPDED